MRTTLARRVTLALLVVLIVSNIVLPRTGVAQALAYQLIQHALVSLEDEVNLREFRLSSADVFKLRSEAIYNNPYVVFLDYNESVYWSDGRLQFVYTRPKSEVADAQAALRTAVNTIVTQVTNTQQTELEKLVALHEYLVQNVSYERTISGAPEEFVYNAYGALLHGKGVCSAYAHALKALLDAVDINSQIVTGMAGNEAHAWNLVEIDGEYYHLDSTWNDPVPDSTGRVRYNYFLLTDEEIRETHSWTSSLPKAASTAFSYLNQMDEAVRAGSWFYYRDSETEEIFKVKLDGSMKQLVVNERSAFLATDGTSLYYSNLSNGGFIYRLDLGTQQKSMLLKESAKELYYAGGWLYYRGWDSNITYRLNTTTRVRQEVIQELSLGTQAITLFAGGQFTFNFDDIVANSYTWSSSNESVAKVHGGKVTALKPGGSVLSVETTDGFTDSCLVIVLEGTNEVILTVGSREATVNGTKMLLPVAPYVKAGVGRTLVPVRLVSEALGAKVEWVDATRQVIITRPGIEILLTIGSDKAYVNGLVHTLDCPAEITVKTTFVPLRFVSETLGAQVNYNDYLKRITILD